MTENNDKGTGVEIHKATIAENWVLRTSAPFGADFLDALAELAWNGRDAGAKNILIEFFRDDQKDLCLRVVDDGMGMNKVRRGAFLNWGLSDWDSTGPVRGKNGNGRLGGVHHCERISAETRADANAKELFVTGFSMSELQEMWRLNKGTWECRPMPPRHPIGKTGTVITLHKLGTGPGVNPRHPRTVKRVVDGLARLLPIDLARMIRVMDEKGVTCELKQRQLRGQVIEGVRDDVPIVGTVSYRLGVVAKHEADVDSVELFALSKVCTLGEFLAAIAKMEAPALHVYLKACRAVLEHPLVSGVIDIPFLNRFVGDARNRVGEMIFDQPDALLAILKFLREQVVPKVENAIGLNSEQIDSSDDDTLIRGLLEQIGTVEAAKRRGGAKADAQTRLSVDAGQFFVLCGGTHEITALDCRQNGTVTWEVRKGGTLDTTTGQRVAFTAGPSPMRGEIRVREEAKGEPMRETIVRPDIVTEFPFQFPIASRSTTPNMRITIRLVYPERVRGKIEWSVPPGVTLERKGDPDEIGIEEIVFSAREIGDYSIEASVPDTDLLKVCTVRVAEPNGTEVTSPTRREFSYQGHDYELQVRNFPPGPEGDKHAVFTTSGGKGRTIIRVNLNNCQFARKPDAIRIPLVLLHIAGIIAEVVLGEESGIINPSALRLKSNEVVAELSSRRKPTTH